MSLTHKFAELVRAIEPQDGAAQTMPLVPLRKPRQIPDADSLRDHLQIALELELSTLPPYLTAMASIVDGTNLDVSGLIRSVMMEEMLHMVLAANVLNAIGGNPVLAKKGVAPEYPTALPDSDGSFLVSVEPLSLGAIQTFMRIEQPTPKHTPAKADGYATIGQFYAAIMEAIVRLSKKGEIRFDHNPGRQVSPSDYYNGHGNVIRVHDSYSAIEALKEITHQGEGNDDTIFESGHVVDGVGYELAHYYRFMEINLGRRFNEGDTPESGPTGALLPVDWSSVKNMISNPKRGWFTADDPRGKLMDECNHSWAMLLRELQAGFRGDKQGIHRAIPWMMKLKYQAQALMNVPSGIAGMMLGPSFEWPEEV
ncbi:MAG: ferritin-like protein [Flavobacteriales bacterium]|nr:ferritin-like protein [Flavobacteriales bacterium]